MLFARRTPPNAAERLRVAVWPRRSYARSISYFRWRLLRLGGNPHGLALGLAAGVFVATLPVLGVQFLAAAVLAWMIRGNVMAALIGTFWANPVTTPVLWFAAHAIGSLLLGGDPGLAAADLVERIWSVRGAIVTPGRETLTTAYRLLLPVLKPMLLGSVPLGLACSVIFYYGCVKLITAYRAARVAPSDLQLMAAHPAFGHEMR